MTQITIPNVPTEVEYSVTSSSTGPFTVPFPFFDDDDVQCLVTDAAGVETTLVVTTDFTWTTQDAPVGQEGNGYSGGSITLVSAIGADGNTTIKIFRSTVVDRTANFPNTGPFSVPLLNDEQNRLIAIMQEFYNELTSNTTDVANSLKRDPVTGASWYGEDVQLKSIAAPTLADDAATKGYADAIAFGGVAVLGGWVNVADHGTVGDGIADDRAAIISALAAVDALGGGVLYFPPGTYVVSQYVHVNTVHNVTFLGTKGSKLSFPSSDTGVGAGTTGSTARARSFFYCEDSNDLTFRELYFVGDDIETDIGVNVGKGIYLNNCKNVSILNCRSDYGGGLFLQDAFANDLGLKVIGNTIYASRNACVSGSDAMIVGNYFEVPDSVGYDRIGSDGSSHCLYFYAGRHNINISNNVFKNCRLNGVKCSGTADTVYNFTICNNTFIDCGRGVSIQSDNAADAQHSSFVVNNNTFQDCGTNRQYWFQDCAVAISGIENCDVSHNTFFYTRHAIYNIAGVYGIEVKRFNASLGTPEQENISIIGNQFCASEGLTPLSIVTYPITVSGGGQGADHQGCVLIKDNTIFGVGSTGVLSNKNIGLVIEGNVFSDLTTAISLVGDRIPLVRNNVMMSVVTGSNNAQLRMSGVSFPIVDNNYTMGRNGSVYAWSWSIGVGVGGAGATAIDHPLLGTHGRLVPNEGFQEVVFGYGDGWQDNDTITIDGNVYTYKETAPGAGEFNDIASLIALIDAEAALTAVDYGNPWGITTEHIRVRDAAANGAAWTVTTSTNRKTAGVLLTNNSTANQCQSRGGQAAPGSLSIIWSPMCHFAATPNLVADNASAATLLATNGFYTSGRVNADSGAVSMIEHGNVAGTEEFRWSITA